MKESNVALFDLVKSLSAAEKRHFKLWVGRIEVNRDSKFIQLFNLLEKIKEYDEDKIIAKSTITKVQLANVSANLYRQILTALRLIPSQQNTRLKIREQLDFATILYNKGLYQQSLKILDRTKKFALELNENYSALEIVEFEKLIETQYITRSLYSRADDLAIVAKDLGIKNVLTSKLSNLSLQLYSFLLKNGYSKNEEDYARTKAYFKEHLPKFNQKDLGFREELYIYMTSLWYSFIIQDFRSSYRYAAKWVHLFEIYPNLIPSNPVFYLKGNNYLLESLYFLRYPSKFSEVYQSFALQTSQTTFTKNDNTRVLSFLYLGYHQINYHFLKGSFQEGILEIPALKNQISEFKGKIDPHHIMVFYYKFACLHFGADEHKNCLFYLDKIVHNKELGMREDLMCYARILKLISSYEAGKDGHIESLIRSTYIYLIKMNDLHLVQQEIISFLKSLSSIYPNELNQAFIGLHMKLKVIENHPFEKRSFLYLDIISWLESKIQGKSIQTIVLEKARLMK